MYQNQICRVWLDEITILYERLQVARSRGLPNNRYFYFRMFRRKKYDQMLYALAEWGKFARSFSEDLRQCSKRLEQIHSAEIRLIVATILGDIGAMFRFATPQKLQDYEEANAIYNEDIKELLKYVTEGEKDD